MFEHETDEQMLERLRRMLDPNIIASGPEYRAMLEWQQRKLHEKAGWTKWPGKADEPAPGVLCEVVAVQHGKVWRVPAYREAQPGRADPTKLELVWCEWDSSNWPICFGGYAFDEDMEIKFWRAMPALPEINGVKRATSDGGGTGAGAGDGSGDSAPGRLEEVSGGAAILGQTELGAEQQRAEGDGQAALQREGVPAPGAARADGAPHGGAARPSPGRPARPIARPILKP